VGCKHRYHVTSSARQRRAARPPGRSSTHISRSLFMAAPRRLQALQRPCVNFRDGPAPDEHNRPASARSRPRRAPCGGVLRQITLLIDAFGP
jgi:hypothetical protein